VLIVLRLQGCKGWLVAFLLCFNPHLICQL
jgi:hypothetical protein